MMPLTQNNSTIMSSSTSIGPPSAATKPKIGFSIDSIVGRNKQLTTTTLLNSNSLQFSPNSESSSEYQSISNSNNNNNNNSKINNSNNINNNFSDTNYPIDFNSHFQNLPLTTQLKLDNFNNKQKLDIEMISNKLLSSIQQPQLIDQRSRTTSPISLVHNPIENIQFNNNNYNKNNNNNNINNKRKIDSPIEKHNVELKNLSDLSESFQDKSRSPTPPPSLNNTSINDNNCNNIDVNNSNNNSNNNNNINNNMKGPILVPGLPPGLIRPFPLQPSDMKSMPTSTAYLNSPEIITTHPNHPHHFLAAQFQMAAALAQGQHFPPHIPTLQPHPSHLQNPNMTRDSYQLYPWLISRNGRIFPHRFPGNFLLQPFRKPKRIRTAFSPTQLLKLEHAFESNHYVVGAERKTLAQALNLSETQVKVWFQNRRTKHKRMQQEEDGKSGNSSSNGNSNREKQLRSISPNNNSNESYDEDELIDMEMDDCPSGEDDDGDDDDGGGNHNSNHHNIEGIRSNYDGGTEHITNIHTINNNNHNIMNHHIMLQ